MKELLQEGPKDYASRRVWPQYRSDVASLGHVLMAGGIQQKTIRDAVEGYDAMKTARTSALQGFLDSYQSGDISAGQLSKRLKAELAAGQREAFRFGLRSAGYVGDIEKQDESWLKNARKYEWSFLNRFMEDLTGGNMRMSADQRLGMYANTLDGFFFHGQVEGYPANTVIYWRLTTGAAHCHDCLALAAEGPYTQETLPTTPRAGFCECLSGCRCYLEYEMQAQGSTGPVAAAPEDFEFDVQGEEGVLGYAAPAGFIPEGFRLPSRDEQAIIDARLLQAAFWRESAMQLKGAEMRSMLTRRDEAIDALDAFLKANQIVMGDNTLLEAAIVGRPPADAIRTAIFDSALSSAALQSLGKGVGKILEEMEACVNDRTV